MNTNAPVWGVRGGLLWALPPGGFHRGEPRGLIRLGYPTLTNDTYDLINFIAIEPVVNGRKGFSELERSGDGRRGKKLLAVDESNPNLMGLVPGELTKSKDGIEQLEVIVDVEPFENGAKVRLLITQRSDAPDEIQLTIYAASNSAPLDFCVLTATMGNRARTRKLWLKNEVADSLEIFKDYKGDGFTKHEIFSLDSLTRTAAGDVIAALTTDEAEPATVFPFPGTRRWYYGGSTVTQFWKKPPGTFKETLQVWVNGRYTYWQSQQTIPGGIAYENFEMREPFYDGQIFVFGITRRTPEQLGIVSKQNAR